MSHVRDLRTGASATTPPNRRRGWLLIGAFLAPALVLYLVFVLAPIGQAAFYSLFDWDGLQPLTDFIGFDNYARAMGDPVFRNAVIHNGLLVALSLALQLPFALGMALLLMQPMRGRTVVRLVFFAPYVLAEVVTAVVFLLILRPHALVDQTLEGMGLGFLVQLWLADPDVVLMTVFVVVTWKYFGFHMILYLAGLQGIPRELTEAAAIDGANRFQAFRHVTLPLLGPTIRISVFLSIIGSLQLFDMVWVLTGGGPVNASNTMATYMYEYGFERFQLGYGSAVAVVLFLLSLMVALAYQRFVLRRDVEGAVTTMAGG
jgi:raffinose/stachyose/melibiose transport system permease protein